MQGICNGSYFAMAFCLGQMCENSQTCGLRKAGRPLEQHLTSINGFVFDHAWHFLLHVCHQWPPREGGSLQCVGEWYRSDVFMSLMGGQQCFGTPDIHYACACMVRQAVDAACSKWKLLPVNATQACIPTLSGFGCNPRSSQGH